MTDSPTGSAESVEERPDAATMVKSLTGWDEIAIEKHFGVPLEDLSNLRRARAMVFVHLRRQGQDDANAYGIAMGMSIGAADGYFPAPPEDDSPAVDLESGEVGPGKA